MRSLGRFGTTIVSVLAASLLWGWAAMPVRAQVGTGIVRVASGGSDAAGCGGAAAPCATIQFAIEQIAAANAGTLSGEIRVASGTYTGSGANVVLLNRLGALTLRGGYSTNNWDASNPTANVTTIDGQNARRGVYMIVGAGQGAQCRITLDGFTITRGRSAADDPFGGGVLVDNCTATLSNLIVTNSRALGSDVGNAGSTTPGAGGGIAIRGSRNAIVDGGAFDSNVTLRNITLRDNQAQGGAGSASSPRGGIGVGGALFVIQTALTGSNIVISGNTAQAGNAPGSTGITPDGQLADGLGGGASLIFSQFALSELQVTGNTAQGGTSGQQGGLGLGGALFIEQSIGSITSATLNSNTTRGGAASIASGKGGSGLGGGIFATDDDLTLDRVTLNQNIATGSNGGAGGSAGDAGGGGIYITKAPSTARSILKASNIIVAANSIAKGSGSGGIAFGGGIFCSSTQMTLDHATLAANQLNGPDIKRGPAIALIGFSAGTGCTGSVRNSIIAGHGDAFSPVYVNEFAGTTTFNTTLWFGNKAPNLENEFNQPVTDQNALGGDPAFVSPGAPNFNYRIGSASAARDKAVGSTLTSDIDGQTRPDGAGADVGADEFSTQILASAVPTAITSSVVVNWSFPGATGIASYELVIVKEAGANDTEPPSPVTNIPASSTSFTVRGLSKDKTYTITVIARDGQGGQVGASSALAVRIGSNLVLLPLVVR